MVIFGITLNVEMARQHEMDMLLKQHEHDLAMQNDRLESSQIQSINEITNGRLSHIDILETAETLMKIYKGTYLERLHRE